MTEYAAFVPGDVAAIEDVKPGDEILVSPRKGYCLVSAVNRYDDDEIVVVYFDTDQASYENRARDKSGYNTRPQLCEKSLALRHAGDEVVVIRGSVGAAETTRERMQREQAERAAAIEERWRRASIAGQTAKANETEHHDPPRDTTLEPRPHICLCSHRVLEHALYRDQTAPGGTYHWGRCSQCGCPAVENETGTIKERR